MRQKIAKYEVKMKPLEQIIGEKASKEKFIIFRYEENVTPRIENLSQFSYKNLKIINKIVKQKNNFIVQEMEEAIKHMSNILDFENKRNFFK